MPAPVMHFKFASPSEPPTDSPGTARARPPQPVRNPGLQGFRCLRCEAPYPLTLANDGCPACRATGVHAGLRASYLPDSGGPLPMPYTPGFTLGEGGTPLLEMPELAREFGVARLALKDESSNPTGSHKDRMTAVGVAQALDFGAHTLVLASSGNAAISAAHYAWAAGLGCEVATYEGLPATYGRQLDALGARRYTFADN